jgi:OmcA/MtrC family decaheme c-type cytochrome
MMHRKLILAALAILLALGGAAILVSASGPVFTVHDKAYYADAAQLNFVRPGLVVKVTSASIGTDGAITATVKLTDPKGLPLDREGITSPGAISVSLIAAYIPSGQTQYTAYTTRVQNSPITGASAIQAGTDTGGTFTKTGEGEYKYTFGTRAPQGFDAGATHTIGVYATRNLTEFDMGSNFADTTYNFVPNGGKVTVVRDVIRTASCNRCHQDVGFHGGARKSMELCILCHQPQTVDPDTGNTVDMAVFIHKIHDGSGLPSVRAGKKYRIIGFNQTVADYSDVTFPADVRTCDTCHAQTGPNAALQANRMFSPTRAACGSCHDNIDFATGKNHIDLPQISDNLCAGCHIKQGELEFDASILGAHTIPRFSKQLGGVVLSIKGVDNAVPGQQATVVFTIRDKKGNFLKPSDLTRLTVYLAGPNADYAFPGVANGYISETALTAVGDGNGTYWWTFARPLPATAKGSWTVAIEGRREVTLNAGTPQQLTGVRDTAVNQQMTFTVDGSKPVPRRQVVSNAKCNVCHNAIAFHGDNRNTVEQCVICHNPAMTAAGAAGKPAQSIEFRTFVHKLHRGKELTREYSIGNANFNEIGFPGDLRNCTACHVNGSENAPSQGVMAVNDPASFLKTVPPTTAACTACHDTKAASSHAASNTNSNGESCETCHGANGDFSVAKIHAH